MQFMKQTIFTLTQILLAFSLSTSVSAAPFDVWDVDPHGMAIFIWTQHGDPELTQQHQILLGNSIEKDFTLAGKYYPTPTQLADFYMTWYAPGFPGDRDELRTSIIDWESIEVSQADIDSALADDILDYVRRTAECAACPSDLVRAGVVRVCPDPTEDGPCRRGCTPMCEEMERRSHRDGNRPNIVMNRRGGGAIEVPKRDYGLDVAYRVVNQEELERRYYDGVFDRKQNLKRFATRVRSTRYREEHPNKRTPAFHTSSGIVSGRPESYWKTMSDAHIRAYDYDRDKIFAGVIMENIIREIQQRSR